MAKNGKDPRYRTLNIVLQSNQIIRQFKDIFKIMPKSVIAKDMHMNNNRMQALIDNPGDYTFAEIKIMADLIGCEYGVLRNLVEKSAGLAVQGRKGGKQIKTPPGSVTGEV